MGLTIVRQTTAQGGFGDAVAAGHAGQCASKLADEHERYGHGPAVATSDPSRAQVCDWCHRDADYEG